MENYFIIKYIHIISAALLFGTGLGTAFFMLLAFLSKNLETLKYTTRHVVLADWIFTTPAVFIQPITGIWLMLMLNYSFYSLWFFLTVSLYILIGICWIPVVFIQYKMKKIATTPLFTQTETKQLSYLMKWWVFLGLIAFFSILGIYWLMVSKFGVGKFLF